MTSYRYVNQEADAVIFVNRRRRRRKMAWALIVALGPIIPIICLGFAPWWLFKKYTSSDKYQEKQRKKEAVRNSKPPKVMQRKRALSISEETAKAKRTKQQQQSRLCTLPPELRLQIYDKIVERRSGIHIVFMDSVLHAYRCQWSRDLTIPARHIQCWNHYCNEDGTATSILDGNSSRLGVLGLLESCRTIYTEYIAHLYSQPTFFFHNYISFIAFSAAIIPERFNTIQSIFIYQHSASSRPNPAPLPDHLMKDIFSGRGNYHFIHAYKFRIRNPILSTLPPTHEIRVESGKWFQVRKILKLMPALREVKVQTFAHSFTPEEEARQEEGQTTDGAVWMREAIDKLWLPQDVEEWKNYEIRTEVFSSGDTWQGVKYLKKKADRK